jgi:crotonobetainyl-CoA:carnitine CoA-transferase CaiB-like acyl-CoA transferase
VTDERTGPLAGIRVLEVGHILAGPFGGMLLADLGADVIKIEPIDGDLSRQVGSRAVDDHNVYFASLNRNKRSVHVDLTTDEGQAQLGLLAATADALLVNLRPSTIRKLGLDYESLRRHNPKIVCVALTGYGLDGPAAEWPAFDYVIQASTGVAAMTGEPGGPPTLAGYSAVDNSSGIMAALGLVAKVLEGKGGQVDIALFDVMLAQLNYRAAAYLNHGDEPTRQPLGAHSFYVPAQLFETASGHLALFVTHDEFWRRLCAEIDRPAWADDERFATMQARFEHRAELLDALGVVLREATAAEWVERLRPLGMAVGEVVDLADVLDGDLVRDRGMVVSVDTEDGPLRMVGNPIRIDGEHPSYGVPPRLHEHTDDLIPPPPDDQAPDDQAPDDQAPDDQPHGDQAETDQAS